MKIMARNRDPEDLRQLNDSINSLLRNLRRIREKTSYQMQREMPISRKPVNKETKSTNETLNSKDKKEDKHVRRRPKVKYDVDENEARGNWSGRLDFIVVCVGYVIGYGNISRFPTLCQKHGGLAFLIPYTVALVFVGLPTLVMDFYLGQYTGTGPLTCWHFAKICRGLGLAMCSSSILFCLDYSVNAAVSLRYLVESLISFSGNQPWMTCDHDFNTPYCLGQEPKKVCWDDGVQNRSDGTCYNVTTGTFHGIWNETLAERNGTTWNISTAEYYYTFILGKTKSSGIEDLGSLQWELCVCYVSIWFLISLALLRGIKSMAKVMYLTTIVPYILMIALLVEGLKIDPSGEGLYDYLGQADLSKIRSFDAWSEAASQVLFSLGLGFGVTLGLASHNRFHHNFIRDAVFVVVIDTVTSILAGFVVYPLLRYLSNVLERPIEEFTRTSVELLFVTYPTATGYTSLPQLWSTLFYLMLVLVGMDTVFCQVEVGLSALTDSFPVLRKHRIILLFLTCGACAGAGLVFCTQGGAYVVHFLDHYLDGWNVILLAAVETMVVSYLYGIPSLRQDIEIMLGRRVCCTPWSVGYSFWAFCWCFCAPLGLVVMTAMAGIHYEPLHDGEYVYPWWTNVVGWLLSLSVVIFTLLVAVALLMVTRGSIKQRIKLLFHPTVYWGPALIQHRKYFSKTRDMVEDPWTSRKTKKGQGTVMFPDADGKPVLI